MDLLATLHSVVSLLSGGIATDDALCERVATALGDLGLRGAVMFREGESSTLVVRALAARHPLIEQVERLTGLTGRGFRFDASTVSVYRAVLERGEAVFVDDARKVLEELVPTAARPFLALLRRAVAGVPSVYAPLLRAGRVIGVLNASGEAVTARDVAALQGFAAGISMALENIHLRQRERRDAASRDAVRTLLSSALHEAPLEASIEQALEVLVERTDRLRGATVTLFAPETGAVRRVLRRWRDDADEAEAAGCAAQTRGARVRREGLACGPCDGDGACGIAGARAIAIADRERLFGVLCVAPQDRSTPLDEGCVELAPIANALGSVIARREAEAGRTEEHARFLHAQRLEALGQLAGSVAHDFNNILTAVVMTSTLLRDDLSPAHPSHTDLEEIERACDRGARLTRQLLMFSRQQPSTPRPLNIASLVRQMEKMLSRLVGEDITLDVALTDDAWMVLADAGALEQALMNLVVNARDAMPDGGRITLGVAQHTNLGGTHPDEPVGDWVCLTVQDTGVGIDDATRARIFEPFFTTKGPERGTGLGLAVVRSVVQEARGRVEVESSPGVGSTFRVWLPRAARPATPSSPPDDDGAPTRANARLLVVDDDVTLARALARYLAKAGHRPALAHTVAEARALAARDPGAFDALVSDVILPDGNGVTFAQELRRMNTRIPVLLMSGYLDEKSRLAEIREHGYAFVPKPFRPADLLARVDDLLASQSAPADTLHAMRDACAPERP